MIPMVRDHLNLRAKCAYEKQQDILMHFQPSGRAAFCSLKRVKTATAFILKLAAGCDVMGLTTSTEYRSNKTKQ